MGWGAVCQTWKSQITCLHCIACIRTRRYWSSIPLYFKSGFMRFDLDMPAYEEPVTPVDCLLSMLDELFQSASGWTISRTGKAGLFRRGIWSAEIMWQEICQWGNIVGRWFGGSLSDTTAITTLFSALKNNSCSKALPFQLLCPLSNQRGSRPDEGYHTAAGRLLLGGKTGLLLCCGW